MNVSLKQVGAKFRLQTDEGGILRQLGPRKLSKNVAEYRLAILNGEEPYDYSDDPTSPEAEAAVTAAIDSYVATQNKNIVTAQDKIDAAEADKVTQQQVIADNQAILDNPEATEEEKAAAQAAITAAEKKIASDESTITLQEKNIATYEDNIANAATKVTSVTISDVPEILTLNDSGYKTTVKADFSTRELTTIQANEKISKDTTIINSGATANLVLDLGISNAILSGNWDVVTVKSVANLTIGTNVKVHEIVIEKGTAKVNNAYVGDNVDNVLEKGGKVVANDPIEATSATSFISNPRIVTVSRGKELSVKNTAFGALTLGHFDFQNNGAVELTGTSGGIIIRGTDVLVDFNGDGSWTSLKNPTVWCGSANAKVRILGGKFFGPNSAECIYCELGLIEIFGGEFHNVPAEGEKNFLLNCKDNNYQSGKANIKVYGGRFYGFNPAANAAESVDMTTNFVAEGFKSIEVGVEESTGLTIYEVVPDSMDPFRKIKEDALVVAEDYPNARSQYFYEAELHLNNTIDEDAEFEINYLRDIHQVIIPVDDEAVTHDVVVFTHSSEGDEKEVYPGASIWGDAEVDVASLNFTFEDAFNVAKKSEFEKPHNKVITLRKPVGQYENPQYIFGNDATGLIFVDAVTGTATWIDPVDYAVSEFRSE